MYYAAGVKAQDVYVGVESVPISTYFEVYTIPAVLFGFFQVFFTFVTTVLLIFSEYAIASLYGTVNMGRIQTRHFWDSFENKKALKENLWASIQILTVLLVYMSTFLVIVVLRHLLGQEGIHPAILED